MLLTAEQLHEIRGIIADHHQAFIVNAISPSAVAPDVLNRLKAKGLVSVKVSSIEDAYLYGHVLAMMEDPKFSGMSYQEFKRHVQKNPIPLNDIERQAVQFAQLQGAQHVRGLGNKVDVATGTLMIEADAKQRAELKEMIRTKTAENIAKRESLKKLKSEMGWASRDWTRDLHRIANTEKQNAMQRGVADHYGKRYGADVRVAKRAMPDACKHCKRLHNGPDGHPRIFKLSELEANGTNVGRKAADWLPVVGTVHPHCQCQMIRIPAGWGFNREGELEPGAEGGKVYESEEELKLAMLREMDLQKSFQIMGTMDFQGLTIDIENKVGTVRKWRDGEGGTGETHMLNAYGYIKRTRGDDEDELDCYIGPDPDATQVYVIHQQDPKTGRWDEAKAMLGFSNKGDARWAYQMHYNRPDFAITCSAMDMDAFKRWVRGTDPAQGEMMKAGKPVIAHVIPIDKLRKARISKEEATTASSSPQARNAPSAGTSANYLFNTPKHDQPPPVEGIKETVEELGQNVEAAVKRDQSVYDFMEPVPKVVRPIVLPDNWPAGDIVGTGETEERREQQERFWLQNSPAVRNTIDPADSEPLSKADTPIGGITPKGYLKVAKDKYVKPGVHVPHGSKFSPHKEDLDKQMFKVPVSDKGKLEGIKAKLSLDGPIIVGSKYAMIEMTASDMDKLGVAMAKIEAETKAPPPAPPKAKAKAKAKAKQTTVPVDAADIKIITQLEVLHDSAIELPKVPENLIQRGTEATIHFGKTAIDGTVLGSDMRGRPVVEVGGKRRTLVKKVSIQRKDKKGKPFTETRYLANWDAVEVAEKKGYQPAFGKLPEGAIVRADDRQQKLVKSVMGLKVAGKHSATEFTDYLRGRGEEVYLVGGIVRDLVAGTHEESTDTDDQVRERMKDIDIVTTGHPGVAAQMFRKISPELPRNGITTDSSRWGVVRSVGMGLGLDYSSMAAGGTYESEEINTDTKEVGPPANWDHDILADARRRDFTCNCLYYDTYNDAIIDPTGTGIADAQNQVLRLAPSPEEAMENNGIFVRFWKFRGRGYKTETETLAFVKKHADYWLSTYQEKPESIAKMLYGAIGKSGDPAKNLEKFGNLMKADGAGDLFTKYIKPHAKQIVAYAKKKGPEA
jgi:hypothetical protein